MVFRKTAVIAAHEVMVGDYLYNNLAWHAAFSAVRVLSVTQAMNLVIIETSDWSTYKRPGEGVAVMRVPVIP